jgi:hypothetical protein
VVLGPPGAAVDHHVVEIAAAVAQLVLVARLARTVAVVTLAQFFAVDGRQAAQHQRCGAHILQSGRGLQALVQQRICSVCTS